MLKFFRQIRQNLISQNKLSKYLFYAIGEIVLVVIGILIALQINNANETRKQRIVERSYLKRLVVDLRENKNLWKERINMQEQQLDGANGILNLSFDENQNEKIRQMLPYFQALATLDDIYINQVTFNEMVSSGNLNLISSDSIRLKLLDLDKQYQIIMNGWENTVKNNDKLIMDILRDETDSDSFEFEIDTYWVQSGGGDPVDWIYQLDGRMRYIHFKDMAMSGREQIFAPVGEGNLNWEKIITACEETAVEWVWCLIYADSFCQVRDIEPRKIHRFQLHGAWPCKRPILIQAAVVRPLNVVGIVCF